MKSIRFYFSPVKLAGHEQKEILDNGKTVGFVRAEICNNMDMMEALRTATPLSGETVLNSVGLDV